MHTLHTSQTHNRNGISRRNVSTNHSIQKRVAPPRAPPPPRRKRASLSGTRSPDLEAARIEVTDNPELNSLVLPNGEHPSDDEMYEVVFRQRVCGMELLPGENKVNAIVGQLLSSVAKAHVTTGSILIAVDRMPVVNWPYTEILNRIANVPRPVKIMFQIPHSAPPMTPISSAVQRAMSGDGDELLDYALSPGESPWGAPSKSAPPQPAKKRRSRKLDAGQFPGGTMLANMFPSNDLNQVSRTELIEAVQKLQQYIRENVNHSSHSRRTPGGSNDPSQFERLKEEYHDLMHAHNELQRQEGITRSALQFKVTELADLRAENEALRTDVREKENRIQELNVANAMCFTQRDANMEDYKRKIEQVGDAFDEAMREKKILVEENGKLRQENARLQSQVEELQLQNNAPQTRRSGLSLVEFLHRRPANAPPEHTAKREHTHRFSSEGHEKEFAESAVEVVSQRRAQSTRNVGTTKKFISKTPEPILESPPQDSTPRKIFRMFEEDEKNFSRSLPASLSTASAHVFPPPPRVESRSPPMGNPPPPPPALRQASTESTGSNSNRVPPRPPSPNRRPQKHNFHSTGNVFHAKSEPPKDRPLPSEKKPSPSPKPTNGNTSSIRAQFEARLHNAESPGSTTSKPATKPHSRAPSKPLTIRPPGVMINVTPAPGLPVGVGHRPRGNAVKKLSARFESNIKRRSSSFSAPSTSRRAQTSAGLI